MIDKRDKRKRDIRKYIPNPVSRNAYNLLWKKRFFRNRDILGKLQFQRKRTLLFLYNFREPRMVKLERA